MMATNYQELLAQREQLNRQIEQARQQQLQTAYTQIREIMESVQITEADLQNHFHRRAKTASPMAGTKVPPKYINPETGEKWTGRGRQPLWVEAALKNGRRLDDLLIPS
jgi:DNA-binding protein H-NS